MLCIVLVTVTFVIATLASSVTLQFVGRQSLISLETTGVGKLRSSGLSAISPLDVANIKTQIIFTDRASSIIIRLVGWLMVGYLPNVVNFTNKISRFGLVTGCYHTQHDRQH